MRLTNRTRWFGALLALAGPLAAAGCSTSQNPGTTITPEVETMADVAGLLRDFTGEFQRGPTKLADTAKNEPLYSRGYHAVRSGTVVVVWGVPMPSTGGGTGVIAYEKKVETEGGLVLLQNGETKQMTAAEFAAAPKAK